MKKSRLDNVIAKAVGVTPRGLRTLARATADPEG